MLRCDDLLPRFSRAWRGVGARGPADALFSALIEAWNAPGRHYHGERHLHDGLARLDGLRPTLRRPNEVELAWWFHDAIQEPGAPDNEERSAEWASRALGEAKADAGAVARIAAAIRATHHAGAPATPDEAALLDLDLAILGAAPDEYDAYAAGVRAEYAMLPDEVWAHGRGAFLDGMVAKERLYFTDAFHEALDATARQNLRRERASLR